MVSFRFAALLLCVSTLSFPAVVTVDPTITNTGGVYNYSYSIAYTGVDDLFLVDIPVAADASAITDLTAPSGFTAQFDSVLGLVSFLEDSSTFGAAPTIGFSFNSTIAPSSVAFDGSVLDSSFNIFSISGITLSATPEPSTLFTISLAALFLALNRRRLLHVRK